MKSHGSWRFGELDGSQMLIRGETMNLADGGTAFSKAPLGPEGQWAVHRVTPPRGQRQSPAGTGHTTAGQQQNPSVPSADGAGLNSSNI